MATFAAKFLRHPVLDTNKDGIRKRERSVGAQVVDFQERRGQNGFYLSQTDAAVLRGWRVDYRITLLRRRSVVLMG